LTRLNKDVKRRLDNIIEKGRTVFVGDANGADKAVQRYFADEEYGRVEVFCIGGSCRNNVGNWLTREIAVPPGSRRDFAYYSAKDRAMGKEADCALMLWDGKSRGTLTNIRDLVGQAKPVVVYIAPNKSFVTIRESGQLETLEKQFNAAGWKMPVASQSAYQKAMALRGKIQLDIDLDISHERHRSRRAIMNT
jgi:adenine-specific DNA-methyltransferase